MGENNRFSFAKTSFGKLHSELSGFLVGEIASLDYSLSVLVGSVSWRCVLSAWYYRLHCSLFRGVKFVLIARSIDTQAFLPHVATFVNRMTDWRGSDSLRGFGGQGRAIDDGNTYFSIFLFSPKQGNKEWQLCTTEGPTPVFKRFGGEGKGHWWQKYIFSVFLFLFPNMSGISAILSCQNSQ